MSSLQTSTSRGKSAGREQLHDDMRRAVQRGRLLASMSVVLLGLAALIGGLFVVALKDAIFVLPVAARAALLAVLVLGALSACIVLAIRPWLNERFNRSTGEQIDDVAQAKQQPVTVGLTLNDSMDDDTLALMLLQRAENRASEVARSVKPNEAYPIRRLLGPTIWLSNTLGIWLVFAIFMPNQAIGMAARVLLPWTDTPPFSFTQMQPYWEHTLVTGGPAYLVLDVETKGLQPEEVDWVLVDEQGNETERFPMQSNGRGWFKYETYAVGSPIDFRLEANGRQTRVYTIPPLTREFATDTAEDTSDEAEDTSGTTTFDPEKAAQRDLDANRDWPGVKAKLQQLLEELGEAQALADRIDPTDADALNGLADKLAKLTAEADKLAGELKAIQGELPDDAAALLDALTAALTDMQSAALPAPPSSSEGTPIGQPTPADWLRQAADAVQADQQKIGQGIGPSDLPTESGTASGTGGADPDFRDPDATGTYDDTAISGNDGPLPDAVMQQVPPSYRTFVSAYFETIANDQTNP